VYSTAKARELTFPERGSRTERIREKRRARVIILLASAISLDFYVVKLRL